MSRERRAKTGGIPPFNSDANRRIVGAVTDQVGSQVDEALILCRALHFAAAITLFGLSVFLATVAPSGIARAIEPPFRRPAAIAIVVIAITTLAWLVLEAGEVVDGWLDAVRTATMSALLFETEFGRVWQWRLAFAAILLLILTLRRHDNWRMTALWSALVLVSLGFVGHAAMHEGALGWLNRGSHGFHVLAASVWVGSLAPLLICLPMLSHPRYGRDAAAALRRFSAIGSVAVAIVLTTGAINTWLILGDWPSDVRSPYQGLLLAKIVLVAAMVGLALVNRYLLTPQLATHPQALRRLRANTIAEIVLALGAIVLVSILGTLPPA